MTTHFLYELIIIYLFFLNSFNLQYIKLTIYHKPIREYVSQILKRLLTGILYFDRSVMLKLMNCRKYTKSFNQRFCYFNNSFSTTSKSPKPWFQDTKDPSKSTL